QSAAKTVLILWARRSGWYHICMVGQAWALISTVVVFAAFPSTVISILTTTRTNEMTRKTGSL
ncbi:MAG: hypothetical protein ABI882_05415, partial [Acidobacteriota bacterium]